VKTLFRSSLIALLFLTAAANPGRATEETYVQVAQPAWDQDGLHITTTAYVDMLGSWVAGSSLRLITSENRMPVRSKKYAHYSRVYALSKELPRLLPSLSGRYRFGHAF
jgi:hypothetical protein